MEEYRNAVDSAEREIREIKAVESELKWNMAREDKRLSRSIKAAAESEIRSWRAKQSEAMKACVVEKVQRNKLQAHEDAADRLGIRRQQRARAKESDRSFERERQAWDKENAQWQTEMAAEVVRCDREVAGRQRQEVFSRREARLSHKQQAKAEEQQDRVFERGLEMSHKLRELSRRKEAALDSLASTRACCEVSPLRGSSRTASPMAARSQRSVGRRP